MHHVVNAPDTSKLFALKWWILCDVNFTKNFFLMLGKGVKGGDRKASQGTTATQQPERRPPPCTHTISVGGGVFTAFQKSVHCQPKCTSGLGFWPRGEHIPGNLLGKMDVTHPKGSLKSSCPVTRLKVQWQLPCLSLHGALEQSGGVLRGAHSFPQFDLPHQTEINLLSWEQLGNFILKQ